MPQIDLKKPAGEAFRSLARKLLAAAARDLKAAGRGAGVHAARKQLKSARSLLQLLRHGLGKQAFASASESLRKAAGLLASARRAEALQEAVAKLATADGEAAPALAELAAMARQSHGHHQAPEALRDATIQALDLVTAVRRDVASWPLAKRDTKPLLRGLKAAYARSRRKLRLGLGQGDIEILHEARTSVIHHLHHLEILQPLWPRLFKAWTAELLDLREALGDLNDLKELDKVMAASATGFSSAETGEQANTAIAGRRKQLLKRVRKTHGRLFAETPSTFTRRMDAMWRHAME